MKGGHTDTLDVHSKDLLITGLAMSRIFFSIIVHLEQVTILLASSTTPG